MILGELAGCCHYQYLDPINPATTIFFRLLLCFTSLTFSFQGQSQIDFDSLWTVWEDENQADTSRLKAMNVITWNGYLFSNPDTAFILAQEMHDLAKEKNIPKMQAQALNIQGVSFWIKGEFDIAIDYYKKNLEVYIGIQDHLGVATSLNNMGLVYRDQGDVKNALNHFLKSALISESIDNKYGIASAKNNAALIYFAIKDYEKSLDFYEESLSIYEEMGLDKGIGTCHNNIGLIYKETEQIDLAKEHFLDAIKYCGLGNDFQGMGNGQYNLGTIYMKDAEEAFDKGDLALFQSLMDTAKSYSQLALDNYTLIGDHRGIASAKVNFSTMFRFEGKMDESIQFGKEALESAQLIGTVYEISGSAKNLYESYKDKDQFETALEMYELHIKFRDSLDNDENKNEIVRQEMQYEYDRQKYEDDLAFENERAISKEQKARQRVIIYAIAGGLLLVVIFAILIANRLRTTRQQKKVIEEQKEIVEVQNKEILDSINYAKRIQSAILPPDKLFKASLPNSFVLYKPKDVVAGDFYWLEHLGGKILFAAADCTGHGVPGAMVSVICNNGLNRSVREHGFSDPGQILNKTRELVISEFEKSEEEVKDGMDIALCALDGYKLRYAGANNPLWIIRKDADEVEEIKADKQPIGKHDEASDFKTHDVHLNPGDSIYIFSDGYADQFGGDKGKKMKTKNFKQLLLSMRSEPIERQKELLDQAFEDWKGNLEQLDDLCVIGVRV